MQDLQPIPGLQTPRQFYVVLDAPAPLAGMEYPGMFMPWRHFFNVGFSSVVCLCGDNIQYNPSPLRLLRAVEMEDLHHGGLPVDPAKNERIVREAVDVIVKQLSKDEGVVVHCIGGTGRTGTVIGCVLRRMGYPADDVIRYLNEVNICRGKRGWPESPWQSDMVRRY